MEKCSKRCHQCKQTKPLGEFYVDNSQRDSFRNKCKCCCNENDRIKNFRKFGITPADYEDMHNRQSGVCAICGRPEKQKKKDVLRKLSIDHDHETGKIRGLLCSNCNRGMGLLGDNIDVLASAISYLQQDYKKASACS